MVDTSPPEKETKKGQAFPTFVLKFWTALGLIGAILSTANIVNDFTDNLIRWYGIFAASVDIYNAAKTQLEQWTVVWWFDDWNSVWTDYIILNALSHRVLRDLAGQSVFTGLVSLAFSKTVLSWNGWASDNFTLASFRYRFFFGGKVLLMATLVGFLAPILLCFSVLYFLAARAHPAARQYIEEKDFVDVNLSVQRLGAFLLIFSVLIAVNYQIVERWWPMRLPH